MLFDDSNINLKQVLEKLCYTFLLINIVKYVMDTMKDLYLVIFPSTRKIYKIKTTAPYEVCIHLNLRIIDTLKPHNLYVNVWLLIKVVP